jgi:multimeric flavodoxin WrbA
MKNLVISGSIRSRKANSKYIFDCAHKSDNLEEYISRIKSYQKSNTCISNSDILAGAILIAMKKCGTHIDYFPLIKLFPKREQEVAFTGDKRIDSEIALTDTLALSRQQFKNFQDRVLTSDGIVLVSPVYFGDRSSVANKLLQLSGIHNFMKDKVFGSVSVGAKRNGGQETTIIYNLIEALNQNALVVGNGPPTSQYGGTAVGGKKGSVVDDNWGLETSFGTGTRVAYTSKLLAKGKQKRLNRAVRILIIITMDDTKQTLHSFLKEYISQAAKNFNNVEIIIENILSATIYRCLGCDACPSNGKQPVGQLPTKKEHGRCIIKNSEDAMAKIHDKLLDADGIIIAGLNVKNHNELVYRYQVLIERTRYIRRNNFELTDKLLTAFSLNQVGEKINSLHSLKTITSYLRHNTIIHKPIEAFIYDDNVLDDGMDDFSNFVKYARIIASGKNNLKPLLTEYKEEGIGGY